MADATFAISSFHGGEVSQFAQGRFDKPDYKTCLNICLNFFPVEIGALVRRPGTQYGGHTRGGNKGRVVEFDFEQSTPATLEFTDGWLRFRNGPSLLTTNDAQTVVSISTANPAVVQMAAAHGWSTGNTVIFPQHLAPLLENRQFTITVVDSTHVSLQDALTGSNIDGSTLGTIVSNAPVERVQELQTVYGAGSWSSETMRSVQAETVTFLFNNSIAPQAVTVSSLPTLNSNALFAIGSVNFLDGPYLDPFTNGVQVTPSAKTGIISLTLSFPAYSATTVYPKGAFVTSAGSNYVSLVDQNLNNTPASSPTDWATTSAGAAINNGAGFSGSDIGRLVRLFSEPAAWSVATAYSIGNVVLYNPSGISGEETYWSALTNNTGNIPGTDVTNWSLLSTNASLWTWGKITSLSNAISGSTGTNIGDMTNNGGLAAAFDGNLSKPAVACAEQNAVSGVTLSGPTPFFLKSYCGKNYTVASGEKIQQVTIYPSSDHGFGLCEYGSTFAGIFSFSTVTTTFNLRAKATVPSSSSDGTLLGTVTMSSDTSNPVTLLSSDTSTIWNFVWVEQINTITVPGDVIPGVPVNFVSLDNFICQEIYQNPPGVGTGSGVNIEILGPSLLYSNVITTWRMGAFGGPNGYPTCGCYAEGRLWMGGAISNRFDASVSNGINGSTVNMAPTDQFGVVADNAAISEVLNSDSVNPITSMKADLQGVVMLTQNGEWLVQAPTTGPISPSNIVARRMTKNGSENIEPVRTPHAHVFVKRYAQKLMEFFADAFSGKYSAPNLADKAQHITAPGIAELSYTDSTTPIIWLRDLLGNLAGITYKRDALVTSQPPDFYGWHRHALGTGRVVESICSGASVGGDLDALTMVTNDPTTNIRHVEVLTDIPNETVSFADSWFLDDAVNPTSTSSTNAPSNGFPYGGLTINGLWHLNGKTVQVFASGLDCGDRGPGTIGFIDFTVVNGSITVPYGDSLSSGPGQGLFTAAYVIANPSLVIGCTYTSQAQLVRMIAPVDTGARNGPALGKLRRIHRYAMLLSNTLGLSVGTTFDKLHPANFKQADQNTPIALNTSFSGVHQQTIEDDYSYDGMVCVEVSRPFPVNIAAISGNLQTMDQ